MREIRKFDLVTVDETRTPEREQTMERKGFRLPTSPFSTGYFPPVKENKSTDLHPLRSGPNKRYSFDPFVVFSIFKWAVLDS